MREFRLDRIVSLAVARPLRRLTGKGSRAAIPILMYHEIRDRQGKRHPYFETGTSLERFTEQMRYLHENGYRSVGLDVTTSDCHLATEPNRRVVITFDDGYRDFYTEAAPVLARYGLTATVFVVSEWAKRANPLGNSKYMTWSEIREIGRNGITIGSHTVSHCELRTLASSCLFYEVAESKRMIEDALGTAIDSFAYPFAFPEKDHELKKRLRSHLQASGYQRGVCTSIGTAQRGSDPFFCRVYPSMSMTICAYSRPSSMEPMTGFAFPRMGTSSQRQDCVRRNPSTAVRSKGLDTLPMQSYASIILA